MSDLHNALNGNALVRFQRTGEDITPYNFYNYITTHFMCNNDKCWARIEGLSYPDGEYSVDNIVNIPLDDISDIKMQLTDLYTWYHLTFRCFSLEIIWFQHDLVEVVDQFEREEDKYITELWEKEIIEDKNDKNKEPAFTEEEKLNMLF